MIDHVAQRLPLFGEGRIDVETIDQAIAAFDHRAVERRKCLGPDVEFANLRTVQCSKQLFRDCARSRPFATRAANDVDDLHPNARSTKMESPSIRAG